MLEELRGKTALVTGASRGIGGATAVALARSGVSRVLLHYNTYREGAEQTMALVQSAEAEATMIQADLATVSGIRILVDNLRHTAPGVVDILVNNAGSLVRRAGLLESTEELFDQVMDLNCKSLWFVSQAVVPHMLRQKEGVIVNVSSIAARNGGGPGATLYAAAKAAVSTITKGLAKELAPKGIRVNAISPGVVDNHFHEQFSSRQSLDAILAMVPARRLGTNDDVAEAIVFLCSHAAHYIHGQTIEINGGMYMN